jgi:hypothetical protein
VHGEGDHGNELATLHDCGSSVTVALAAPEAAHLAAELGDAGGLLRVTERSGSSWRAAYRRTRAAPRERFRRGRRPSG